MNTNGKVIVGIIVVIVIVAAGYYWYSSHKNYAANGTSMTSTSMPSETTTASGAAVTPLPAGSNTSDAALTQDTAAIDAQMNTLNTDNAQASQSVSGN